MKELIQLINFSKENSMGKFIHNSCYTLNFNDMGKIKDCKIYCFEYNDGDIQNIIYSPDEYYIKLSKSKELLFQLSKYELDSLRLIMSKKSDFILYDFDYCSDKLTYYFMYNFRKLEVEVDSKMNISVFEQVEFKKVKCSLPGEDYILLAALVKELFKDDQFELESAEYTNIYSVG